MANDGLSTRIAHVIEDLHGDNHVSQSVVNALVLEAMVWNGEQIVILRKQTFAHSEEHHDIEARYQARSIQRDKERDELEKRLGKIEGVVYFPRRSPGKFLGGAAIIFVALSTWFVSGARLAILEMFNAPDWLINIFNPGVLP